MPDAAHEAAMRAARAIVPKVGITGAIDADEKRRKSVEAIASLILAHTGLAECVEALEEGRRWLAFDIDNNAIRPAEGDEESSHVEALQEMDAALALVRQGPRA